MSGWSVERVEALDGFTIEWASEGKYLVSKGSRLFRSSTLQPPFEPLGRVSAPFWQRATSMARPVQRLLRFMFYNVVDCADGSVFVTFGKQVGVFRNGAYEPLAGLQRPSRFLRGACAVAPDGSIYLGEYLPNGDRGPMAVYRWHLGARHLEIAYRFPRGSIRHIHGIYWDPFDACFWCVTGDNGQEARIIRTSDFKALETIGSGDETWRCVSLLFTEDSIYYGMDAEFVPNGLYRIDRRTLGRTRLGDIGGPVYYSHALRQDLFFAVTAELCPSQQDGAATLWHVDTENRCTRVVSFQKDRLPVGAFLPGTLDFPRGPGVLDRFWFRGTGITAGDATTFRVTRCPS